MIAEYMIQIDMLFPLVTTLYLCILNRFGHTLDDGDTFWKSRTADCKLT